MTVTFCEGGGCGRSRILVCCCVLAEEKRPTMKARVAYLVETGVIESKTVVAGKYDGRQQKIRSHATSCWVRRNSKLLKQER